MVDGFAERWLVRGAVACDLETAVTQLSELCLRAMTPVRRCERTVLEGAPARHDTCEEAV
jgi:hypothetical protein